MLQPRASRSNALVAVLLCASAAVLAGCSTGGSGKAGGAAASADEVVTLRFAAGETRPFDQLFAEAVARRSGGRIRLAFVQYDAPSTSVDVLIARDLEAGRLDVADVASRAWESEGVNGFQAFQEPFPDNRRVLAVLAFLRG